MKRFHQFIIFITGFIDVKHSIKAKIFVPFATVTIIITTIISLYWYQHIIQSTKATLVESMEKIVHSSLARIENAYQDVMLVHSMLIYNFSCTNYFIRDVPTPPTYEWFTLYNQLYNSMYTMGISMSRTVLGTGVFKADGSTCVNGTLSTPLSFAGLKDVLLNTANPPADDMMFFFEKSQGEFNYALNKYVFIGRIVYSMGDEKSIIVSKMHDSLFNLAFSEAAWPEGFILVFDKQYEFIYDSAPDTSFMEKYHFRDQLLEGSTSIVSQTHTVVYKTVENIGISVLSAIPNDYIRKSNRGIRNQFVVSLLLLMAAEALLSMFLSNMITYKLRTLEQAMERADDGFMTHALVIHGDDEISKLGKTYLRMVDQIKKLMADIKSNEQQKRQAEIKMLRAQISPHFLYNSLNTIGYLAMIQNARNIHSLVLSLIHLLQGAVHVDDALVPLEEEIDYVKSYLNLQQYRFQRRIQTDFRLDPRAEDCLIPKMILQPIVENALLHGLGDDQENPAIIIKAYILGENLVISITDNGKGMDGEKIHEILEDSINHEKQRFSSIGIGNVHTRIRLQFGDEYGLSIFSQKKLFTTVEIRLPVAAGEKEEPFHDQGTVD